MFVCINAGHDRLLDSGAVGLNGLREADVTYDVMLMVTEYLENNGIAVLNVQVDDLDYICKVANRENVDLFVSLHCNAAESRQAHGFEVWTSRGETNADILATEIINCVEEVFPDLYIRKDYSDGDPDKEAGFYVLNHTHAPAVLVEMAFISNPQEEELLSNYWFKSTMAAEIARGIINYFNKM